MVSNARNITPHDNPARSRFNENINVSTIVMGKPLTYNRTFGKNIHKRNWTPYEQKTARLSLHCYCRTGFDEARSDS